MPKESIRADLEVLSMDLVASLEDLDEPGGDWSAPLCIAEEILSAAEALMDAADADEESQ